jgi:hypothetical protein
MKLIEIQMIVYTTNIKYPEKLFKESSFKFYVNASVDYFHPNIAPYFINEPPKEFIAQNDSLIESIKLP